MNKTAREWFKELPSPIREMAVENSEKEKIIDLKWSSLDNAVWSLNWDDSIQGYDFWFNVRRKDYGTALALLKPKAESTVDLSTKAKRDAYSDKYAFTSEVVKELTGCISDIVTANESDITKSFEPSQDYYEPITKHPPHRHKFSPIKFN